MKKQETNPLMRFKWENVVFLTAFMWLTVDALNRDMPATANLGKLMGDLLIAYIICLCLRIIRKNPREFWVDIFKLFED